MALALKEKGFAKHIIGVENNPIHAEKALSLGLADKIDTLENAIASTELILVAIPVNAAEKILPFILESST
jgi:prephenate dehydrogenase